MNCLTFKTDSGIFFIACFDLQGGEQRRGQPEAEGDLAVVMFARPTATHYKITLVISSTNLRGPVSRAETSSNGILEMPPLSSITFSLLNEITRLMIRSPTILETRRGILCGVTSRRSILAIQATGMAS